MASVYLGKDEELLVETKRSSMAWIPAFLLMLILVGGGIGAYLGIMSAINSMNADDPAPSGVMTFLKIIFIGLMVLMVGGGFFNFVGTIIRLKCDYLILTNKKIHGRRGVIRKETFDIVLEKVDTVRVNNSFFGGMLGYGTLEVVSPSSSRIVRGNTVNPKFNYIVNCQEFMMKVMEALDAMHENKSK